MAIPQDARHIANQRGDFVPQHQNNWVLEIAGLPGDGKDLIVLSLRSGALPNESNEPIVIPYGNEERKVAGKAKFADMPLKVNDWVDRKVRKAIVDWRKQVYDPETGNIGLPSLYKKSAEIILYASDGTRTRSVRLVGLWPSAVEGGELNMEGMEVVQINMTLQYDRAIWNL